MNKNATFKKELSENGNVLIKGSIENYEMFYKSKVVIFSHSLSSDIAPYLYALPGMRKIYDNVFKVFTSHGVEGFKRKSIVNKGLSKMKEEILKGYDLQFAVGEFEKDIKIHSWGIEPNKIEITGLPRFDKLEKDEVQNTIFYMPTWRGWITEDNFKQSDYYRNIIELITNKSLNNFLVENQLYVNVCMHQLMYKFLNEFELELPSNIKILEKGTDIQEQLIKSRMLITDYSSVSWDMLHMEKPVVFFQFDSNEYKELLGSYLNFSDEIFGDVVHDSKDCINKIIEISDKNFEMDEEFKVKRKTYFKYIDKNNTQRVIDTIKNRIK